MGLLRFSRNAAIGISLLALTGPKLAIADCPPGSGDEFPYLTDTQYTCLRTSFLATLDYFNTFLAAREDCFYKVISGNALPDTLDCLFPVSNEQPGTTGDPDVDRRLRAAEAGMTRRILTHCTNVDLAVLGYPGFCPDPNGPPYDTFDHNKCLLDRSKKLGTLLLDVEHPPYPGDLTRPQQGCEDLVGRHSSNMTSQEFDTRGRCLLHQAIREIPLPPEIDCRREVDVQDPQVGRGITDNTVVEAHNFILRGIPNACPAINIETLGYPHRCLFPNNQSVFPLPALVECMFDYHHHDVFRFLDLIFPCSTKCGNSVLNLEEECDDGDNDWALGDVCRIDCSRVPCGDVNDDGVRNATDALLVLRSAVGLQSCSLLVCDIDGDMHLRASDALRLLQYAVGLPVLLQCPDLSTTCGNGYLETKETCDDGDTSYDNGEYCNAACLLVECGDTDDSGSVNILDSQFILNTSVGNHTCDKSICDVTGNGAINSTDALRTLMHSVGLPVVFDCPRPPHTPPPPVEE